MNEKVELRKRVKRRKPKFLARNAGGKKCLALRWRKPKGSDNKMRWRVKGHRAVVKIGYKGPKESRGMHKSGLFGLLVNCIGDLKDADPKKHVIIIASNVGERKKIEILKNVKGFKVLGVKDADAYVKNAEENMKKKKQSQTEDKKAKEEKKKELEKAAKEKEKKENKETKKEESLSEKINKDEEEKKEKNKLLIKNQ